MSNEDAATAKQDNFQSWFMDKLLIGMSWPEYLRKLITPFNIVAAAILSVGLPLIAIRFTQGLASVTDASNDYEYTDWVAVEDFSLSFAERLKPPP